MSAGPMNLVVFLARAGVGSRRSCDELVRSGVVTVNDEVVTFPRHKVGEGDTVAVNGDPVALRTLRYVLVNKPRGVASTRSDPHAERVIVDLVPDGRTLFPVGRLDVDTTGLIVLTNDGVLANRLMHPRYGVPKTYTVRVRGKVTRRALASLRQGVILEDGVTAPADVDLRKQSAKTALLDLTIHEGRKRQVRRMFQALGLPVEELHRRRYGPLSDKGLAPGGFRELGGDDVDALRRAGEDVDTALAGEVEGDPLPLAAVETAPEPVAEAAPEPVVETVPEALAETAPQPAVEPAAEAAPEPAVEAAPEAPSDTVPEAPADPVAGQAADPDPEPPADDSD